MNKDGAISLVDINQVTGESHPGLAVRFRERWEETSAGGDVNQKINFRRPKEEMYNDFSFNPIYKLDGTVWSVMVATYLLTCLHFLRCRILELACQIIMKSLQNNQDIPYALIYLVENNKDLKTGINSLVARLVATTFDKVCKEEFIHEKLKRHIPDYFPKTHEIIDLIKASDQDYDAYIEVKYATSTYSFLRSVLICGINLLRKLDDEYMEFYKNFDPWNVNRRRKRRAKILTDLNFQKDMFFQSISHKLKTPLTLIFSPLDELINICSQDTQIKSYLQIIQPNTCRLHKLINTLLQIFHATQYNGNINLVNQLSHVRQL
ncbi:hypothetical protein C2G38_2198949 [Gigaspora rosea]|uniref:Signal transduction histidine kinase dimerisation/phosphoacceptor domain-containing protein n=1 Tax=Gigaspora rosea TaxID=44941 RepID=A0A397UUJ6_9GLOM|nr:hypothetical protein C2G38_2198949 [Gigaspora rosea]